MKSLKAVSVGVLGVVLAFILTTFIALEWGGVVTVTTSIPETQEVRETHIWFIVKGDVVLLEAGSLNNPWVTDLASTGTLHLGGEGLDGEYSFSKMPVASHSMIRQEMRLKYGWRDWWISMLFDTSESYAIELNKLD